MGRLPFAAMDSVAAEICEVGRWAYERGLVAAKEGNLSVRLDAERVLCTPSGVCKGRMRPEELCIVALDGRQISGPRRRTSEIPLHLALYRAEARINAVMHTHPPFATTFALVGKSIPGGLLPEAEIILGSVPLVPYATTGTEELADAIRPFAKAHRAAILQNHGAVTWGATLDEAYSLTETLEAVCRVVFQARQIGFPKPIPAHQLAALRAAAARYRGE